MSFQAEALPPSSTSTLSDTSGRTWTPLYTHSCTFPPEIFREVMLNLIRNPNIDSTHLFRADILLDTKYADHSAGQAGVRAKITHFSGYDLQTIMVRTLVPRKPKVDFPMDQTCLLYEKQGGQGELQSLVVYLPHFTSPSESPFYHPAIQGIAFLHIYDTTTRTATVSIDYAFFDSLPRSAKLERTAQHLLSSVYKHGQGRASGYVKRVQHDVIVPQAAVQNKYSELKSKYARPIIDSWVEATDPGKHVFEDLGIAAFLIELWKDMYKHDSFPGFVDIGCGNGLLVHILLEEGYTGWGFDARARKSWSIYGAKAKDNLHEMVLIPAIIQSKTQTPSTASNEGVLLQDSKEEISATQFETVTTANNDKDAKIHNGLFPSGTFIISNHADELTPWTPILASLSASPFMMIPCCSHALNGARYRAPPSKEAGVSNSAYASLVTWVSEIARQCGWSIETEMLRIPSTRNTALIGRTRAGNNGGDVVEEMKKLVDDYGGAAGWEENALKLVSASARGH